MEEENQKMLKTRLWVKKLVKIQGVQRQLQCFDSAACYFLSIRDNAAALLRNARRLHA
jgi:hypothetical protein